MDPWRSQSLHPEERISGYRSSNFQGDQSYIGKIQCFKSFQINLVGYSTPVLADRSRWYHSRSWSTAPSNGLRFGNVTSEEVRSRSNIRLGIN
jgi:hypothetical protein